MAENRGMGRRPEQAAFSPQQGNNYLLVIGIDHYRHWQPLQNAVRDAKSFVDVLTTQYQFEPGDVISLYDEEATEANIYRSLRDLKQKITERDNLMIYYSGHGHYDTDFDEGYWVPVDAHPDNEGQYISNANIVKRINALTTHHTLLIVDSCFSGSLVIRKRNAVPDERFKSRRILASGRNETVSDGREGQNSPFAAGMLTYLRKNTSRNLDTTSLIHYVKEYVHGKANQTPVDGRIQNSDDEGGEFVFHLRRSEEEIWREVSKQQTVEAYRNYLSAFPQGQYVTQATRQLAVLQEDEIWRLARANDNELAYENYLKQYTPQGKYLAEARGRLEQLKTEREQRQRVRAEVAEQQQHRETLREEYSRLVQRAEELFAQRQLAAAREQYRAALLAFLPGFVPNQKYLEEQIDLCQTNITFLRHYADGKQAMESGNYRLAVEFFQEALKIEPNAQVQDLLQHCRARLEGPRQPVRETQQRRNDFVEYTPPPPRPPVRQKQKKSWRPWVVGGVVGVVLCFVILVVIAVVLDEGGPIGGDYGQRNLYETPLGGDVDDGYTNTGYTDDPKANPPPPATPAQQIIGRWRVMEINVDGTPLQNINPAMAYLIGSVMNFGTDNVMREYTTLGEQLAYAYQIDGNAIYIASPGYQQGMITYVDDQDLTLLIPFSNGVYTFQMEFILTKE